MDSINYAEWISLGSSLHNALSVRLEKFSSHNLNLNDFGYWHSFWALICKLLSYQSIIKNDAIHFSILNLISQFFEVASYLSVDFAS